MEQNHEQIEAQSHTVTTEENLVKKEGESTAEISLGKFKDVASLLKAYNSLESEFTKRCQRIKELEGAKSIDKTEEQTSNVPTEDGGKTDTAKVETEKNSEQEFLRKYLQSVIGTKQQAVILGAEGVGVKTPAQKPTTIEQAGKLAKQIF